MEKSVSDMLKIALFCFFFIAIISVGFSSSSGCIPGEREALLEFKVKLKDPSNRLLQSWNEENGDCCKWYGVICSNLTSHVLELHLANLLDEGDHLKSRFGGEISASLLNLKSLRYLDLSNNAFGGIPIPTFLGSLGSLKFLNLSYAGFGGMIPHELGNLSNLHYLDLHNGFTFNDNNNQDNTNPSFNFDDKYNEVDPNPSFFSLSVDSLDWLSGLALLEFLDLSYVDLSQSFHWLRSMNKLSSLLELHLSHCLIVHIPPLLNVNFSSLSILGLSGNYFPESRIPNWIFGLNNLKVLDLSVNDFEGPIHNHLQNMTSLGNLDLFYNQFSRIPKWIVSLKTLHSLNLASNNFQGPIPDELQNISSIKELNLYQNDFNSSIPSWLYNFRHLEFLDLAGNSLGGKISGAIQNMTSLTNIDLSENVEFEGGIPKSFENICNLRSLSLSQTKLGQEINDILDILSVCASNMLEFLDLSDCELSGTLNNQLGNFKSLTYLRLSVNKISGPIPLSVGELKSLKNLLLDHNKLGGTIPAALGGLAELVEIDLSYNLLEGVVSEMHFSNFTKLKRFDGSRNQLILRVSSDWIPPFLRLQVLALSCWDVGVQFPSWLPTLKYVKVLDLSNSRISSNIPNWFWNSSSQFSYLNLSHNQIRGVIPDINRSSDIMDLSSNLFEGSLPLISSNMLLDVSNNSFSGSISHFICHKMNEEKDMVVLDLGNNLLTGEIPDCWFNWIFLTSLRLSNNIFSGNIPRSIGKLTSLGFLHLWNNSLSGEIPSSLQNCTSLTTLDLGENKLIGSIPSWIGTKFSVMSILILRANKFRDNILENICHLSSFQILDLSSNSLSGTIPNCINNFTFMATTASPVGGFSLRLSSGYGMTVFAGDDAMIMIKGRTVEYETILKFVKIMDLSSNNLSGQIPKETTKLSALQSLNLSNNFLSGKIYEDIGDMKWLEVLDLSRNQLNGRIPQSITSLTFLSMLNVSYNKLSGRIPTGTQLQSFPSSSFICNEGLWEPSLVDNKSTTRSGAPPSGGNGKEEGDEDKVDWGLYVSMSVGFIVGFWSILCPLILNRRWRHAYYVFLNGLWKKIWWHFRWCRG